jgi:LPXTG-site transpeptidase (sortase) family protein
MYILSNQTVGGMEIAACQLYTTGELNKSGKTLIVGHNYRNGKLFSNNNKLNIGDTIKITTLDGIVKTYTIYNKIITTPEDVSFLINESEVPEIILSCCSDDNVKRIVIMAR